MKIFVLAAVLYFPIICFSQDIKFYKATNGVTYHLNDTVRLGRGTGENGVFLYIEERGPTLPAPGHTPSGHGLPKEYANAGVILKAIKVIQVNGGNKYLFVVNTGGLFRFGLYIDDAIAACEVKPCTVTNVQQVSTGSVADEILKWKKLLDAGAITQAEYDAQKKKLLGN